MCVLAGAGIRFIAARAARDTAARHHTRAPMGSIETSQAMANSTRSTWAGHGMALRFIAQVEIGCVG